MKTKRKFVMRKCSNCDHDFVDPLTMFRLPDELELLAKALELPPATVAALLDRGTILTRKMIEAGRPHGPRLVLLKDAYKALEGSRGNIL